MRSKSQKLAGLGIVSLTLALAGWGGYRLVADRSPESQTAGRAELVQALNGRRPIEGRLSGGFTYAPYRQASRGALSGEAGSAPESFFRQPLRGSAKAEREIERSIEGQNSPEALSARGTLHLFHQEADRAVRELDKAANLAPSNAWILSDLAAAYLARAREKDDPHDLVLALATADKAFAIDRDLPEAHFNRALALEKLFLLSPARAAWEDYRQLDPRSDWAVEAGNHLTTLAQPSPAGAWSEMYSLLDKPEVDQQTVDEIVKQFPQEARQYVEDSLLGSWADRFLEGKQEQAAQNLNAARRIATSLAVRFGEHMPADAVAAIDRALSVQSNKEQINALAGGHHAYREGRLLDKQFRAPEARPLFDRARRAFARGQSPAAALASLYIAIGYYQQYQYGKAFQALDVCLPQETASGRHPGLLGRAYWLVALMHLGNGEPSLSLSAYQQALSAMNRAGGAEGIAGVNAAMAETLRYLGQSREAWSHLYRALAYIQSIRVPRRLQAILGGFAEICEAEGTWSVARYFRDEAVRIAKSSTDPAIYAQALLRSSQTQMQAGNESGAEANLVEARRTVERIPDETLRKRTEADLLIAESILRPSDSRDALTGALAFFESKSNHFLVSALLLARARAYRAVGDEASAEEDLRQGIEEYERQRSRVDEEESKISFFDGAESLFHEMIWLQAIDFRNAEAALDFAERGKARALLDRLGPISRKQKQKIITGSVEPLTSEEIRQRLPDGIAILEYVLLEDRLLIWVIRHDGIQLAESPADSRSVNALAERFRTSIVERRSRTEQVSAASDLFDLTIRPALRHIQPQDVLVLVPDQGLHSIPFVALVDRDTQRYLIEDHAVTLMPSATLAVATVERNLGLRSRPTALVVGNPTFRKDLAQQLPNLPEAEVEAKEIGELLPGSEILTRESAIKSRFISAAGRYDIIHFGGHAVTNQAFPLLSYLVLSPEGPGDSGLLYAHELYSVHFEKPRLAVLAACDTASGPIYGEGTVSLARAFMVAGVPNVIASLWVVGDSPASFLLQGFYRQLLRVGDPVAALRNAQVSFIKATDAGLRDPAIWAAFEVLGNNSSKGGRS
jgi:CHAT domain-containing protein